MRALRTFCLASALLTGTALLSDRSPAQTWQSSSVDSFERRVRELVAADETERLAALHDCLLHGGSALMREVASRIGPESAAWVPRLRAELELEDPHTWWSAHKILARVDAWADQASADELMRLDRAKSERLREALLDRSSRFWSPTEELTRRSYQEWQLRERVRGLGSVEEITAELERTDLHPLTAERLGEVLASQDPVSIALVGPLRSVFANRFDSGSPYGNPDGEADVRRALRATARAITHIAPDDVDAVEAWIWLLADRSTTPDEAERAAARLSRPGSSARWILPQLLSLATRDAPTHRHQLALDVLLALGPEASGAIDGLERTAAGSTCSLRTARRLDVAAVLRRAQLDAWRYADDERQLRERVDRELDRLLVCDDPSELEAQLDRLVGYGALTSQALVDHVLRGPGSAYELARSHPAGALVDELIARLGTAHGASVRRLRDEWERGSPLTRAWALDLYERMGPWSGLVGPGDVPLLDAKDEASALRAWYGPAYPAPKFQPMLAGELQHRSQALDWIRRAFAIDPGGNAAELLRILEQAAPDPIAVALCVQGLSLHPNHADSDGAAILPSLRALTRRLNPQVFTYSFMDREGPRARRVVLETILLAEPGRESDGSLVSSLAHGRRAAPSTLVRLAYRIGELPPDPDAGWLVTQLNWLYRAPTLRRPAQRQPVLEALQKHAPLPGHEIDVLVLAMRERGAPDWELRRLAELPRR